jgi:hypothetical protein
MTVHVIGSVNRSRPEGILLDDMALLLMETLSSTRSKATGPPPPPSSLLHHVCLAPLSSSSNSVNHQPCTGSDRHRHHYRW